MNIADKIVGEGKPVFIIAEAGVNHNGSLEIAKQLVDAAVRAGVDAVKFQSFIAEEEVTKLAQKADYQVKEGEEEENYYALIKKLEFNKKTQQELLEYARTQGILLFSTPSEEKSAQLLEELGMPLYKIGSNDIITLPMLAQIARYGKPMILSRGMATEEEIAQALVTIQDEGNQDIALLHCTSNYPTPLKDANLRAMQTLKEKFGQITGYSDHTEGIVAPLIATVLGAEIIEKHFTLDKNLPGPDHSFALDPRELKEMVLKIREIEKYTSQEKKDYLTKMDDLDVILGGGLLEPNEEELKMRIFTRKSIVAREDLLAGTELSLENIAFKRPGDGILVNQYEKVLGKKLSCALEEDQQLAYEMLE